MSYIKSKNRGLNTLPVIIMNHSRAMVHLTNGKKLVCIIRHGQTEWNTVKRLQGREDVPLNETGIKQALKLAEIMLDIKTLGLNIDKIYSSPLVRAYDTAKILSDALHLETPEIIENLIERDYGSLSGLTLEERRKIFPQGERQADNVESVPVAGERMEKTIKDLCSRTNGDTVFCVSHGGILNAFFSRITSGEIGTGKNLSVNCGLSLVAADTDSVVPLAFNLQNESAVRYIRRLMSDEKNHII